MFLQKKDCRDSKQPGVHVADYTQGRLYRRYNAATQQVIGGDIPTYINFLSFTEQGVKTIKDLPARIAVGRQAIEANGGKLLNYYLTLSTQDAVVVYEFPDDETTASMALAQAGLGNLRTTTMRAFTEAEIPGVLRKMP